MRTTPQYTIHHLPFLRLLLPLVAGIVWHYYAPHTVPFAVCGGVAVVAAIVAWSTRRKAMRKMHKAAFITATTAAMTAIGAGVCTLHTAQPPQPLMHDNTLAIARIEERPLEQEHSYRIQATVIAWDDDSAKRSAHIPLLLNIEKSYTASQLTCGDIIIFRPSLRRIEGNPIPHAFDYSRYMGQQGILYRQYLPEGEWQRTSFHTPHTLHSRAMQLQTRCIDNLYESGITEDNAHLLSALLWGYKANIPQEMRDCFSAAGLSHILAVSGLHTGIILFILWLILFPLRYTRIGKVRHIITLALLWVYAFVAGLSPSIIRACIMATFVGVAALIGRRNTSLNALCGSAFIVLLIEPMQLFDIGFQLSYTAVGGIILLSPYLDLSRHYDIRHRAVQYACGVVAVAIAAQLSTLMMTAYYFNYIPTQGLLANIIITPLLPILVLTALLLQLFTALQLPHTWLTTLTDRLTGTLTQGADTIASLPGATLDAISISLPLLLLYIIAIVVVWYSLSRKTLRTLPVLLCCIVVMQLITLSDNTRASQPLLLIPLQQGHTTLQLTDAQHHCYILTTDTTRTMPRHGEEWRIKEHLDTHIVAPHDTIESPHIYIASPFISYYGNSILWVDSDTWRYCHSDTTLAIDYLIITEQYRGKISHLVESFAPQHIILSGAIFPEKRDQLQEECQEREIACTTIEQHTILNLAER